MDLPIENMGTWGFEVGHRLDDVAHQEWLPSLRGRNHRGGAAEAGTPWGVFEAETL